MRADIDWSMTYLYIIVIGTVYGIAVALPNHDIIYGLISPVIAAGLLGVTGMLLVQGLYRSTIKAIERFTPNTMLQAKIANEQIKLTSTIMNNLAVAAIGYVVISKLVAGPHNGDGLVMAVALTVALQLHAGAKGLLGRMKDEAFKELLTAKAI